VERAISGTDGILYHRGHVYGRGSAGGKEVTIGYSSASKVWSSRSARVGELIEWCQQLARKLASNAEVKTGTNLDLLDVGGELAALPENIIGVAWHEDIYKNARRI